MTRAMPFKHGPNPDNSLEYDVANYTLDKQAALEVAYTILGHYRPTVLPGRTPLPLKTPEALEKP